MRNVATKPTLVINAKPESPAAYFKKLWQHRALGLTLAKRDLKAKYAQTLIGILWSVLQPLISLFIFSFFFEKVVRIGDTINYPYAIFAFSGMICWNYFTQHIHTAGTALMQEQALLKKISFPKLLLPLSKALVGLVDYCIALGLLFLLMAWKGVSLSWNVIYLPIFLTLNILVALSVSVWLSALTIRYRDFHHLIPYLVNFSIWITPVFYPSTLVPEYYKWIIYCNPMAAVIEGFRWCLVGQSDWNSNFSISIIMSVLLLIAGFIYFIKMEDKIIDFI